jgi:ATP-dependent Clp protease ATP-binding subunit ClpB
MLVGAGRNSGAMDAGNILKPALARGELRTIGATTLKEYQRYFEQDKALERRFQKVLVEEPGTEDAISILRGIKEKYEAHHKVRIKDDAVIASVELSQRYISDRFLPDKAIDLMDEAAAKLRLEINSKPEELERVERRLMQLQIERAAIKREGDTTKIKQISEEISQLETQKKELEGRWQAEKAIVERIQKAKTELESLKNQAEQAERAGDYGKVAEIRYGRMAELNQNLKDAQQALKEKQGAEAMIKEEVDAEDIAEVVSRWTGIPIQRMLQTERQRLLNLEAELGKRVVGQTEAVEAVSDAVRRNRAGLQDPNRPIGSFIFMGSTGIGKTELAKALAEVMFDSENAMTRIDMSEYQEKHAVSRLVGSPPGYVGYEEGGQLTEAVRNRPYSVLLFDEMEKAHPDVFNVLLQVLDDGHLTDSKGRKVNFKNTLIIFTSNLGSNAIQEKMEAALPGQEEQALQSAKLAVFELLRKSIRPEFLNRIDETIMFLPLNRSEIQQIVGIQLKKMVKNMEEQNGIKIEISQKALEWLSELGYDPAFGARPLKRVIQRKLLNELATLILEDKIDKNKTVIIDCVERCIEFFQDNRPLIKGEKNRVQD